VWNRSELLTSVADPESADSGDSRARPVDREGRFPGVTVTLRRHTARGTLINAGFRIGIAGVALLQRVLVAVFLTPEQLGVWGLVLISLLAFLFIKEAGISDKFVQQSEPDQERAFQKAFTFDLIVTAAFVLAAGIALPVFAAAYGQPEIILPGLILLLAVIGNSFQAPTWIFYRQMNFIRQRSLEAIEPVVMFVVTIGLAAAGASYWSLVIGAVVGAWAGGAAALVASPYRFAFQPDRRASRDYFSFSWPLVVASLSAVVVAQGSVLVGSHTVGLEGVGAIALAISIIAFSDGVDAIVTQTLYPAVCAARNRADLFLESFVKSNRLALMWGMPFGFGVALFGADLVNFVLGERWDLAIVLLQAFGIKAALDQIGFNWTAFLRARNQTRPLATVGVVMAGSFLIIAVPLLIVDGLRGYAIGMLAMTLITVGARAYYLGRLFPGLRIASHAFRALAPTVPAIGVVLAARLVEVGDRTLGLALAELALYCAVTAIATWTLEKPLIREMLGYLRRDRPAPAGAVHAGTSGARA
jgi:O-antigen/teichoic acid export membrane protein